MLTNQPKLPVIRAILAVYEEGFWQAESAQHEAQACRPHARLLADVLSGTIAHQLMALGLALARV